MNQAFSRLNAYLAAFQGLLASVGRVAAIQQLGHYQSRGKGRNRISPKFGKSRSKYIPHEGKKQQARANQIMVMGKNGHETMKTLPRGVTFDSFWHE